MATESKNRTHPSTADTALDHALVIAQKILMLSAALIAFSIISNIFTYSWNQRAMIIEDFATISPI